MDNFIQHNYITLTGDGDLIDKNNKIKYNIECYDT